MVTVIDAYDEHCGWIATDHRGRHEPFLTEGRLNPLRAVAELGSRSRPLAVQIRRSGSIFTCSVLCATPQGPRRQEIDLLAGLALGAAGTRTTFIQTAGDPRTRGLVQSAES